MNYQGEGISDDAAIRLVWVYSAIRNLSADISSLPLHLFERGEGSRVQLELPSFLTTPNPETDQTYELIEQIVVSLETEGNAYVVPIRDTRGNVLELWVLNPFKVDVQRSMANEKIFIVTEDNRELEIASQDMVHISNMKSPGSLKGMSKLSVMRQQTNTLNEMQKHSRTYFKNASRPSGVITLEKGTTPEEIEKTREVWKATAEGASNAGKVPVLMGAKFEPISVTFQDMQFVEVQKMTQRQIAAVYRIPPHMLGDLERATFSNIEHQSIEYVTHSLRPTMIKIEKKLSTLLPAGQFLKLNEKALLRGDMKSEAEANKIGIDGGWLTRNDVRATLDLAPSDDATASSLWGPLNMGPIDSSKPLTEKERFQMVALMVQAGFKPSDVMDVIGIDSIEHSRSYAVNTSSRI